MKKLNFNQKFEPEGNKIIHGAGQSLETFSNYWEAVEKYKPAIYMTYVRINTVKDWSKKIKSELKHFPNLMVQIGLNFKIKKEGSKCLEVANGEYDREIKYFCEAIKEIKNSVFVRIGYEFNENKKYNPKEFIKAWRYLVNKFKENKVDNVAVVWCACTSFSENIEEIMSYYPGDDYVDWFGEDIFGTRHFIKGRVKRIREAFFKEAKKHKKPVMIGESSASKVSVLNGKESWDGWFKPYFKLIVNDSVIKAFCYINWDWAIDWKTPEWGNCRIEDNEIVRKNYVKELSKPYYIHNKK